MMKHFLMASLLLNPSAINAVDDIPLRSKLGRSLMSKARQLRENDDNIDTSWLVNYSIMFSKCHEVFMYGVEGAREAENKMGTQKLATFRLCPSNSCSGRCNGPQYVVELRDFVEAYMDSKDQARENLCDKEKDTCEEYCQNNDDFNDDQKCLNQCYINAGLDFCVEDDDNDDEIDLGRYMECSELENYQDNDDNGQQYYVGPRCVNGGTSVFLGVFSDAGCSTLAPKGTYEKSNYYGKSLPYERQSVVGHDCVTCINHDNDDDDDGYPEASEMCEELHDRSGKCERGLNLNSDTYYTPSYEGCEFMYRTLPALESVSKTGGSSLRTATFFAWFFALTTIGLGFVSYYFYKKTERSGVILSDQGIDAVEANRKNTTGRFSPFGSGKGIWS